MRPIAGLLAVGLIACGAVREARPGKARSTVVLLVFDELPVASLMRPDGNIDSKLFPNFARLQRDSTWFRNATSPGTFTHDVIPSILTGSLPSERLQESSFLPDNLFTLLAPTHRVYTTQPFPRMCPPTTCSPMPQARTDDPLRHRFPVFSKGDRGRKYLSLGSATQGATEPRFLFAHFVLPHQPWAYLPDGRRYLAGETLPGQYDSDGRGKGWSDEWWLTAQALQRHLLQLRFTDLLLGTLLDRLERAGIYEGTTMVVVADHGIAFERGQPKRMPTPETVGELAAVPFFFKKPHQRRGWISDRPVQLTDIAPTIADVLGLRLKWRGLEGVSVFDRRSKRPDRSVAGLPMKSDGSEKYLAVRRKYSTFGQRRGSLDLFRLGPRWAQDLVGRHVDDLARSMEAVPADISYPAAFDRASATSPIVPSLLQGSIPGTPEDNVLLAVTVDGRVAAVTPTYVEGDASRFYCMLPPRLLNEAPNRVEIFRL
ncbi:MAG TPA: sulfatase-like hydrolase/transferase [Actinomycetota bacterium]|nr:sulfatase-like hydrolase/transferase [Actinomycetota bacterium]